jgi:hypothetical protein
MVVSVVSVAEEPAASPVKMKVWNDSENCEENSGINQKISVAWVSYPPSRQAMIRMVEFEHRPVWTVPNNRSLIKA